MFTYAVNILGHDEGFAYSAINIARKSVQFPALRSAVSTSKLSVGKASRIASSLTLENAAELVEFACTHTTDQINQEVARRNPERERLDRVKWKSEVLVEITTTMKSKDYEKLKRAENLEAPKKRGEAIGLCLDEYLFKHDSVQKAERSKKKAEKFCNTEKPSHRKVTWQLASAGKLSLERVRIFLFRNPPVLVPPSSCAGLKQLPVAFLVFSPETIFKV